jgi:hypothetical protein
VRKDDILTDGGVAAAKSAVHSESSADAKPGAAGKPPGRARFKPGQRLAPPEVLVALDGATGMPVLVALLLAPAPALLSAPLSLPSVWVPLIVLLLELRPLLLVLSW